MATHAKKRTTAKGIHEQEVRAQMLREQMEVAAAVANTPPTPPAVIEPMLPALPGTPEFVSKSIEALKKQDATWETSKAILPAPEAHEKASEEVLTGRWSEEFDGLTPQEKAEYRMRKLEADAVMYAAYWKAQAKGKSAPQQNVQINLDTGGIPVNGGPIRVVEGQTASAPENPSRNSSPSSRRPETESTSRPDSPEAGTP